MYGAGGQGSDVLVPDHVEGEDLVVEGRLVVTGVKATLTSQAAAALNATFHVSLVKAGLSIGTAAVYART